MTEQQQGWGGPVAILVAGVIMTIIHYARVALERRDKIHNPSPTAGGEWGANEEPQLSDVDIPLDWDDSEADVDLEERPAGWHARPPLDDWIMQNLDELGFRQCVNRGALLYGVAPRTMTQRIRDLKNAGFDF